MRPCIVSATVVAAPHLPKKHGDLSGAPSFLQTNDLAIAVVTPLTEPTLKFHPASEPILVLPFRRVHSLALFKP